MSLSTLFRRRSKVGFRKPTKTNRVRRYLSERAEVIQSNSSTKLDKDNGIIFDVIILGPKSQNTHGVAGATEGTKYTVAAMERARLKFEDVHVRVGHPDGDPSTGDFDPNDKDTADQFGVLRNIRIVNERMIGDLHYLKSHPLAASVIESVERKINVFSLSQNAYSHGTVVDGWFVVDEIEEVWSVDLVNRGATTGVLVAERLKAKAKGKNMKLRKIIAVLKERVLPLLKGKHKQALTRTLEDDVIPPDATMNEDEEAYDEEDEEAAAPDPMEVLNDAFVSACVAVLQGDGTKDEILSKIGELLDHKEAINAGSEAPATEAEEETEEDEDEEEDDKEEGKGGKTSERLKRVEKMLGQLLKKNADKPDAKASRVVAECKRFKFNPSKDQVAILEKMDRRSLTRTVRELASVNKTTSTGSGYVDDNNNDEKLATAHGEDLARLMV